MMKYLPYMHDCYRIRIKELEKEEDQMVKMNRVVLAGIGIAGLSYFSSRNNREKARVMMNNMRMKADSWIKKKKHKSSSMTKVGHSNPYDIADNTMLSEGAMYSVDYYNVTEQDKNK